MERGQIRVPRGAIQTKTLYTLAKVCPASAMGCCGTRSNTPTCFNSTPEILTVTEYFLISDKIESLLLPGLLRKFLPCFDSGGKNSSRNRCSEARFIFTRQTPHCLLAVISTQAHTLSKKVFIDQSTSSSNLALRQSKDELCVFLSFNKSRLTNLRFSEGGLSRW